MREKLREYAILTLGVFVILLGAGCGRANINTEIRPDGSWTRQFVLHAPVQKQGEAPGPASFGPKLDEVFSYPSTPPWKVTKQTAKDEYTITTERTLAAGETSQPGAILKGDKGVPLVTDSVTVRQTAPGKFEYRETLHWVGARDKVVEGFPDKELTAAIRAALPAATDADVQVLQHNVFMAFWRAMFGPGDPIMGQLFFHTDLAERKATRMLGATINRTLTERFGDKMTPETRLAAARKIVHSLIEGTLKGGKEKANPAAGAQQDNSGMAALVPFTFGVHMPGRITSSNGEIDEVAGDVYWAMYGLAPALEDVTLTATCETGK